jgi:cell division protein FtsW (lipid II flippase)
VEAVDVDVILPLAPFGIETMDFRRKLTLLAGIICGFIALLLLLLAVFLAFSTGDIGQSAVFAVISVFPLLIAIACLRPAYRTIALRLVGGITAAAIGGILLTSYINPDVEIGRRGRACYFATLAGSVVIAVKGSWPSSNSNSGKPPDGRMPVAGYCLHFRVARVAKTLGFCMVTEDQIWASGGGRIRTFCTRWLAPAATSC